MGGGLSSGPSAPKRSIGAEWPQIRNLYRSQFNQFRNFEQQDPLLGTAIPMALGFAGGLPGLLSPLMSQYGNIPGVSGFTNALTNLFGSTGRNFSSLQNTLGGLINPLQGALRNTINPIIASGGALTAPQERDVSQATRSIFASQGNVGGNQAAGAELLNRQSAQQNRFNTALAQSGAVTGEIGQIEGERAGIMGQGAQTQLGIASGIEGLLGSNIGIRSGLAGSIQGLESGGLNQLLAPGQAAAQEFTSLTDPLLGYAGNLFSGNQAAQLQTQMANQNKMAGILGGGASATGSILSSILPIIMASDKRLKHKIKATGETTPEGIPIKTFQFKGDPNRQRYIGVIAQDVQREAPHAVFRLPSGHLGVNFRSISAPYHAIGRPRAGRSQQGGEDPSIEPSPIPMVSGRENPSTIAGGGDPTPFTRWAARGYPAPSGRADRMNQGNDFPAANNLSGFGTNPSFGASAFGPTAIPTWWVNYPGVGNVPMAVPLGGWPNLGAQDDPNLGSGQHGR